MFNSVFCSFTLELLQIVRLVSLDLIGQFGAVHRTRGSDSTWVVDAGANGLNYAQRGKPVAKRPRFLQKEAKWTLGSRTGLQLPLNSGCDRHADRDTAFRFGYDSD